MFVHTYTHAGKNEIVVMLSCYGAETNTLVVQIVNTLSGMFEVLCIKEQTTVSIYIKEISIICYFKHQIVANSTNPTVFNFITFL